MFLPSVAFPASLAVFLWLCWKEQISLLRGFLLLLFFLFFCKFRGLLSDLRNPSTFTLCQWQPCFLVLLWVSSTFIIFSVVFDKILEWRNKVFMSPFTHFLGVVILRSVHRLQMEEFLFEKPKEVIQCLFECFLCTATVLKYFR